MSRLNSECLFKHVVLCSHPYFPLLEQGIVTSQFKMAMKFSIRMLTKLTKVTLEKRVVNLDDRKWRGFTSSFTDYDTCMSFYLTHRDKKRKETKKTCFSPDIVFYHILVFLA